MPHGTWTTTGGGGVITAGGVLAAAGAVVVIADRHGIERAAGEVLTVLAVVVIAFLVLAVAGIVLLGRFLRRGEERFAAQLAQHRTVPAATLRAVPGRTVQALPVAQPQTVIHHHWHGDLGAQMLRSLSESGQAGEQR